MKEELKTLKEYTKYILYINEPVIDESINILIMTLITLNKVNTKKIAMYYAESLIDYELRFGEEEAKNILHFYEDVIESIIEEALNLELYEVVSNLKSFSNEYWLNYY